MFKFLLQGLALARPYGLRLSIGMLCGFLAGIANPMLMVSVKLAVNTVLAKTGELIGPNPLDASPAFLRKTNHLKWRTGMTPVAAPTYRVSPSLLFWVALALGGLFGAAAVLLGGRWYLSVRPQRAAPHVDSGTPLERALAVLRYAHQHGEETLQRKAFERVAGELGVERADELTYIARELAWSSRTPEDEEVEEFAEQARGTQEETE